MKMLINSPNVCLRMLIAIKNACCHKITKIEASQGVLLVDNIIFDQLLSHSCEYSLFIRVLVFEYSYERICKMIRILFVVRSNEPRIPKLRIRGYEYLHYSKPRNLEVRKKTFVF